MLWRKRVIPFISATSTLVRTGAYQAAHLLERVMRDFDPLLIREKLDDMHKVEHAADEKKHEVLDALVKAFINPHRAGGHHPAQPEHR